MLMLVTSRVPHLDGSGTFRDTGDVYELTAEPELSLRLKDYIVAPAPESAPTDSPPNTTLPC